MQDESAHELAIAEAVEVGITRGRIRSACVRLANDLEAGASAALFRQFAASWQTAALLGKLGSEALDLAATYPPLLDLEPERVGKLGISGMAPSGVAFARS